ncbi:uncharacterized protein DSM5745_09866 [Aspergillus mulundensis]|uniref:Nephrocystin 3-like N-terminal domain-containing protein n=1 Tax=Aspergillus mulundensis TaxID=1810919 RepID=A0A3D8QRN4_9EURO|nr:hypothetical protein DSM5745_09866 [Aspergillus mulundensis]RDW64455.1 hypothetical protein DSM5745_09866 [Aspergillus mulundensis]
MLAEPPEVSSTDASDHINSLKRRRGDRVAGTCSQILDTEEMKHWLGQGSGMANDREDRNILWLHGNPGTGKSTMAITLVEELAQTPFFQDEDKILAYFFCDTSMEKTRNVTSLPGALLHSYHDKYKNSMLSLAVNLDCDEDSEKITSADRGRHIYLAISGMQSEVIISWIGAEVIALLLARAENQIELIASLLYIAESNLAVRDSVEILLNRQYPSLMKALSELDAGEIIASAAKIGSPWEGS